ncbi:MAG: hypothetical protein M3Q30_02720 [Actinomycetota bacterium]|nr:hypothetical protein [Actinomycetota bacterium]
MADPPTRLDLIKFSYQEVLDATKHQDDKIGRMLAAIAFLTGGALVFAKTDFLTVTYHLGARHYYLTALFLGCFLLFDLLAVILFILNVGTPLSHPGVIANTGRTESHIFFNIIARTKPDRWQTMWTTPTAELDEHLSDAFVDELIDETYNLAKRTQGKNRRSRIGSTSFLAGVLFLVPTLALSIDSASGWRGVASVGNTLEWGTSQRLLVGIPVALVVFALVLTAWAQPRTIKREYRIATHERRPLPDVAFAYPLFVGATIVGDGWRTVWPAVVMSVGAGSGVLIACLVWMLSSPKNRRDNPKKRQYIWPALWFLLTLGVVALASFVTYQRRTDSQLLIGMIAALLVLTEYLRPYRVRELEAYDAGTTVAQAGETEAAKAVAAHTIEEAK